jgi:hypothetical protein
MGQPGCGSDFFENCGLDDRWSFLVMVESFRTPIKANLGVTVVVPKRSMKGVGDEILPDFPRNYLGCRRCWKFDDPVLWGKRVKKDIK